MKVPPWQLWEVRLRERGQPAQRFSLIQQHGAGRAGLIVAVWNLVHECVGYWSQVGELARFDDQTRAQDPQLYRTLKGARARIKHLSEARQRYPGGAPISGLRRDYAHFGLAYWRHPEADVQSLEWYLKSTGLEVPWQS